MVMLWFRTSGGIRNLVSAIMISALSLYATAAAAELLVIGSVFNTSGQDRWTELSSGDILRSGDRFRLAVVADSDGPLTVTLRSGNGEETALHQTSDAQPGRSKWLPNATESYVLDDAPGIETITVTDAAGTETFEIVHVGRDFLTRGVGPGLLDRAEFGAPTSDSAPPMIEDSVVMRAVAEPSSRATAYAAAIGALQPDPEPLRTRGAKEARLYRKYASGVVLVVTKEGTGSGSLISDGGLILTNWHVVVGDKSPAVVFKPPTGVAIEISNAYNTTIVRGDRTADLALLQLTRLPPRRTVLKLGRMEDIEIGMDVHAIGHPKKEFWTYSTGIVTQIRPNYQWRTEIGRHIATVVQTQTPISPGSSGGPLLSDAGKIIGVNSFFRKGGAGLNFAISAKEINRFVNAGLRTSSPSTQQSRQQSRRQAAATPAGCARKLLLEYHSKKGTLIQPFDTNCNGIADIYVIPNFGGGGERRYLFDEDEDGKVDSELHPGVDGKYDLWVYYDEDFNETMLGYDYDKDGKVDKYTKISPN